MYGSLGIAYFNMTEEELAEASQVMELPALAIKIASATAPLYIFGWYEGGKQKMIEYT